MINSLSELRFVDKTAQILRNTIVSNECLHDSVAYKNISAHHNSQNSSLQLLVFILSFVIFPQPKMNSTPENYGIVKTAVGEARLQPIPIPRLRDDYILVKTIAVAINPTDWQTIDEQTSPRTKSPTLLGCDFAGIVVEIGKGVEKEWKKGDRIAGMAHGGLLLI